MSNYAIQVNDLGKMYRIGGPQQSGQTFRETINRVALSPFRKVRDLVSGQAYGAAGLEEEIWALQSISFDVQHGEVIGIIGRNGAGKSTLLKILSRITEPSKGYADIYGRVGALLEVGTGFHSELTGRENVYLNGAILGMSRRDIDRKFDEIVAFSGVEKFIDTPVKHYSSGMGLRLGFAVAAHLEPEILVVDEVLAVGDAEFQKKCLGKMSEVAGEGRTVLFVSHNMGAVQNLCSRVIVLDTGKVSKEGSVKDAIAFYMNRFESNSLVRDLSKVNRNSSKNLITKIQIHNESIETLGYFGFDVFANLDPDIMNEVNLGITINDGIGGRIYDAYSTQYVKHTVEQKQLVKFSITIDSLNLSPGTYSISLNLGDTIRVIDSVEDAINFSVLWTNPNSIHFPPRDWWGPVFFPLKWDVSIQDE